MKRRGIVNSLLRIEKVRGEAPRPFERPNGDMNFWVLELPTRHDSPRQWTLQVGRVLRKHSKLLRELRRKHALLTLFIETAGGPTHLRLEVNFLKLLSELEIALEHFDS